MNLNSISPMSDDFDEYPEINQANLDISIRRRNFVEVPKKQHPFMNQRNKHAKHLPSNSRHINRIELEHT
jgi:hypothetical protein